MRKNSLGKSITRVAGTIKKWAGGSIIKTAINFFSVAIILLKEY